MAAQTESSMPSILGMEGSLAAFALLLAVMVITGLFGGWAAYLIESKRKKADDAEAGVGEGKPPALRFLVLGIVAATSVPLFLSLVQSGIVRDILTAGSSLYESLLIFVGLCMVAALSAQRFLDSVTRRLLQQVEQQGRDLERTEQRAQGAEQTAQTARSEVELLSEQVEAEDEGAGAPPELSAPQAPLPPETGAEGSEAPDEPARAGQDEVEATPDVFRDKVEGLQDIPPTPLTEAELKVLRALTMMSRRTVAGIQKDSGLARDQVLATLGELERRKFVTLTESLKTGSPRWQISFWGRTALITQR